MFDLFIFVHTDSQIAICCFSESRLDLKARPESSVEFCV